MRCLTDDCPALASGKKSPIFLSIPNFDTVGWVRCMIPVDEDCDVKVFLDVREDDFDELPVWTGMIRERLTVIE